MKFFNRDNAKEIGKRGGDAKFAKHGVEGARAAGKALVQRYGTEHMSKIGKIGFKATCDKYYGGNTDALMYALHERGLLNNADRELIMLKQLYQQRLPGIFDD